MTVVSWRGEIWLAGVWYGHSWWYLALLPLSWLYRGVTGMRRTLYRRGVLRSCRLGVPVIVIGNITVGGTGKTPLTILLTQQLKRRGFSPGIVSRGYRGKVGATPVSVNADSDPVRVGDEAVLLAKRCACPVVVHPDRVAAARVLKAQGVDVIVADDGLQHYRLARDMEIVVVDGERMWGNRQLLPAGPLREPLGRLNGVHRILLQTENDSIQIPALAPAARFDTFSLRPSAVYRLDGTEHRSLATYKGQRVHAVAAIGNPHRFFDMLTKAGMNVERHAFPDHAALTDTDLTFDQPYDVVMTEKDAIKCRGMKKNNLWYIPVDAVIRDSAMVSLIEQIETMIKNNE